MPHPTESIESLWGHWAAAAEAEPIDAALRGFYDRLAAEIEQRSPTCWISGRCCKFDSHGHRLYVTGLEIAWLVRRLDPEGRSRLRRASLPEINGCPFQIDGLCSVHPLRPLGCRTYFCDPDAQSWQNSVYERFLTDLRRLHDRHDIEYRYMEWRAGLAEARGVTP